MKDEEEILWPCNLTISAKTSLLSGARTLVLDTGEYTSIGEEKTNGLSYLVQGRIVISPVNFSKACPLLALKKGEWFGGTMLAGDPRFQYQITSIENTKLLFIPAQAISDSAEKYPEIYKFLYLITSERARDVFEMLYASVGMKLEQKVAYFLLEVSRRFPSVAGAKPMISMSQAMLAQVLGLSRLSLSEQLHLLEQKAIISIERQRIYVIDLTSLEAMAMKL